MFRRFQQVLFSIHFSSSKKRQYSEFRKNDIALVFGWFSQAIFVVTSAPMKIHTLS